MTPHLMDKYVRIGAGRKRHMITDARKNLIRTACGYLVPDTLAQIYSSAPFSTICKQCMKEKRESAISRRPDKIGRENEDERDVGSTDQN